MLSPASVVQPYDEGDGDEEMGLELQTQPEPGNRAPAGLSITLPRRKVIRRSGCREFNESAASRLALAELAHR